MPDVHVCTHNMKDGIVHMVTPWLVCVLGQSRGHRQYVVVHSKGHKQYIAVLLATTAHGYSHKGLQQHMYVHTRDYSSTYLFTQGVTAAYSCSHNGVTTAHGCSHKAPQQHMAVHTRSTAAHSCSHKGQQQHMDVHTMGQQQHMPVHTRAIVAHGCSQKWAVWLFIQGVLN